MSVTLIHLMNVDSLKQKLTANLFITQRWTDEFLTWNLKDFPVNRSLWPKSKVWTPDIEILNLIETPESINPRGLVSVSHTGQITFTDGIKVVIPCEIIVYKFPFDSHVCRFIAGSWMYQKHSLIVSHWETPNHSFSNHSEWSIDSIDGRISDEYFGGEIYHTLYFNLGIRRLPGTYLWSLLLPSVSLLVIGAVAFCIPADGDRLALNITTLLSFTVFLLQIPNLLPAQSNGLSLISVFLGVCVLLFTESACGTVLVMALSKGKETKVMQVGLFLSIFRRLCRRREEKVELEEQKDVEELEVDRLARILDRGFAAMFLFGFAANLLWFFIGTRADLKPTMRSSDSLYGL